MDPSIFDWKSTWVSLCYIYASSCRTSVAETFSRHIEENWEYQWSCYRDRGSTCSARWKFGYAVLICICGGLSLQHSGITSITLGVMNRRCSSLLKHTSIMTLYAFTSRFVVRVKKPESCSTSTSCSTNHCGSCISTYITNCFSSVWSTYITRLTVCCICIRIVSSVTFTNESICWGIRVHTRFTERLCSFSACCITRMSSVSGIFWPVAHDSIEFTAVHGRASNVSRTPTIPIESTASASSTIRAETGSETSIAISVLVQS